MEAWAKENIPVLMKQGNGTGDLLGALKNYTTHLEALLSQKEADHALAERATGVGANKQAVKEALAEGDVKKALEKKAFFLLKWDRWRDLKHPDIQRLIDVARATGDKRLLIRLGRALEQEPMVKCPNDLDIDKLSFVLIEWWVNGPEGQMGLCRLTDEALTEFCNLALGRKDLTLSNVRKTRQRWGLKKGAKPWLKKVEKTKKGIIISH